MSPESATDTSTSGQTDHAAVDIATQVVNDLIRSKLAEDVADLVVAALLSEEVLMKALGGSRPPRPMHQSVEARSTGIYLRSIAVEGFRGVGPRQSLQLQPSPGLTLIVGRNGSGKSSFAEAAEIAITGRSSRWDERSKVWRSGWRNLHHRSTGIQVQVAEEGAGAPLSIRCDWVQDAPLEQASATFRRGGQLRPLTDLGWSGALANYRPFLSYAELGDAVTGRPTQLHDALWSILGLHDVDAAKKRLAALVKESSDRARAVKQGAAALADRLEGINDERCIRAAAQLRLPKSNLAELTDLATGASTVPDPRILGWQSMTHATFPASDDVRAAVAALEKALDQAHRAEDELGATSLRVAEILELAAQHVDASGPGPCPLCGATQLDGEWSATAHARAHELRAGARAVQDARTGLASAKQRLSALCASASPASMFEVVHPDVASALDEWHRLAAEPLTHDLASHIGEVAGELGAKVFEARQSARENVQAHQDLWQPVAVDLAAWLGQAEAVAGAEADLDRLRKADRWLGAEAKRLRDVRMLPFAAHSSVVWERLRQESNVSIGSVKLIGSGPQRKLDIGVSVDGQEGAALGVMSQGELHALGLSLFIPRAAADASPFRFLVIDDPVQAMDPAKVDGLARVLEEVARTRQVVVFTHDDRLPDAVSRLGIAATVWEVVRRPNSVVELRKLTDVVTRYLDDARAVAKTDKLPTEVRGLVVAGFLRSAIEAAALERARRRMTDQGLERHVMQTRVDNARDTNSLVALAMFNDVKRGGDVLGRLNQWGPSMADTYQLCRKAVHDSDVTRLDEAALMGLATTVANLTRKLATT